MSAICKCLSEEKMHGAEGAKYTAEHLIEIAYNQDTWETLYECPETGVLWVKTYPHAEYHGGGSPDFVKIATRKKKAIAVKEQWLQAQ
jgi:hypothetical protein